MASDPTALFTEEFSVFFLIQKSLVFFFILIFASFSYIFICIDIIWMFSIFKDCSVAFLDFSLTSCSY